MKFDLTKDQFKDLFSKYCAGATPKSGKGGSYALAIVYMIEFLDGNGFNDDIYNRILDKEQDVFNKKSTFYKNFLKHLEDAGHKSYLDNGYVSAAIPELKKFWDNPEVLKKDGEKELSKKTEDMSVKQKIFFGSPGTGKSFKVNQLVGNTENVFRATFHPDYDYAQFVGSYKPKKDKDDSKRIVYEFVPQVFANAYAAAWKNLSQPVYLVIEEINRGNCAQIFGDLFQLLDRNENGFSDYSIDADSDFSEWLKTESKLKDSWSEYVSTSYDKKNENGEVEIIHPVSDEKIALPPNFNILATMNTSDQSLFPMDSAFKRRFDWEYVPIDFEGKDCANYQIKVDDENSYPWQKFVESVNEKIVSITDSEDKQLGEYFIKLNPVDNNVITKERFLGKVMFYLWNEVCKDVHKQESFFREGESEGYFTFQDLYKKDGDKKLISFMNWITK